MDFSIIIPLYNEQKNVNDLLESLRNLNYDSSLFEIIMVDNRSTDDTAEVVAGFGQVILLQEGKRGSYAARNKGVEYAKGRYICFTDADCLVDTNWLLEAKKATTQKKESPEMIAGKIINTEPDKNLFSRYDDLCFLKQERLVSDGGAATANLVTKKEVFDIAGKFDARMSTGGDMEFVQRAVQHGFKLVYNEKMIVYHKSRTSFSQVRNKLLRFWKNERRYPGLFNKIVSLCVFPGAKTIIKAFQDQSIRLKEFVFLLFLSLLLGISVTGVVIRQKLL